MIWRVIVVVVDAFRFVWKKKSDKSDKSGSFDDVAERVRAVHSLKRLTRRNPEKALAWLMPLADNVAERAEVTLKSPLEPPLDLRHALASEK